MLVCERQAVHVVDAYYFHYYYCYYNSIGTDLMSIDKTIYFECVATMTTPNDERTSISTAFRGVIILHDRLATQKKFIFSIVFGLTICVIEIIWIWWTTNQNAVKVNNICTCPIKVPEIWCGHLVIIWWRRKWRHIVFISVEVVQVFIIVVIIVVFIITECFIVWFD